ncbi:uncharacterized protein C4orf19 homolog [Rhineura floridana]|uniref:uncharacterized protein C4orf19 homolog n=1 Tax=Rhineura floridana TaxID=261503 RepID=UPI002AC7E9F2|nr:uncharacterized protein C4orf19 homolog [Rhineura floridana]XP_061440589.1 uncharacterized protein C4orf19 homolog [Rhineura floridana]XP_061440590.1 uncharacterized protein C4orf19 homolog [Rhineura floridana]
MGCRCCKMIQSYIFDPQEVQTSGYVNEINNYKPDEQDGGKFKCKLNNDIQVHKNELQKAELQPPAIRHKLNNTKDAVQNHKSTAVHEEGLGNLVEKCNVSVNGIHSHSGVNLNPNTNQSREIATDTYSGQRSNSSAKGVSQPNTCNNHRILETEDHPKLSSETTGSVLYGESQSAGENTSTTQSAILEAQGNGTHLPEPTDHQNASHAGKQRAVGRESLLNNHTHADENTECTTTSNHWDLPLCESKSHNSTDQACRTGPSNVCFKDKVSDDTPYSRTKRGAVQEDRYDCHNEINGELEEEDAEVAEALAALEAATAGEDFEEEEDY